MASAVDESEGRYCDRTYWDARYETTGSTLFDWYQDYDGGLDALLKVRVSGRAPIHTHMRPAPGALASSREDE